MPTGAGNVGNAGALLGAVSGGSAGMAGAEDFVAMGVGSAGAVVVGRMGVTAVGFCCTMGIAVAGAGLATGAVAAAGVGSLNSCSTIDSACTFAIGFFTRFFFFVRFTWVFAAGCFSTVSVCGVLALAGA